MGPAAKAWNDSTANPTALLDQIATREYGIANLWAEIERLKSELTAAPRWVPVDSVVSDGEYYIVYGRIANSVCPTFHDAAESEDGWVTESGKPLTVTHVLANLNPPTASEATNPEGCADCNGPLQPSNGSCAACCDTGCEVDPTIPLVESPAECLVPCKECNPQQQCRDMLGRDVVAGDAMWDTAIKRLDTVKRMLFDDYVRSVRCPRPGELIPEFDGWREMVRAMQESGAKFNYAPKGAEWSYDRSDWIFGATAADYRRSPSCTWKGPK